MTPLHKALFDMEVSHVMMRQWTIHHFDPRLAAIAREDQKRSYKFGLALIILGYVVFSFFGQYPSIKMSVYISSIIFPALGVLQIVFSVFQKRESTDIEFLNDALRLRQIIASAEYMDECSLKQSAEKRLIYLANGVFIVEREQGLASAESNRLRFADDHRLFLRFDLVDEKWDQYFKKAREARRDEPEMVGTSSS